jgi:periplasmic protein TonB
LQEEVRDVNVGTKDQEGDPDIVAPPTEAPVEAAPEIFTIVEEMPEPPGGISAFYKYIGSHIQYPAMAREAGITGKVHLQFVIEMDGTITDVQILKGVPGCGECDREAVRVLKAADKWKPGRQNGRPARVRYSFPINFKLQ